MKKIILSLSFVLCGIAVFAQKVGIGTTSPAFKLDVKDGSINTDSVYRIGGNTVLTIKGQWKYFYRCQ